MIKVRITNPTSETKSYAWVKRGLVLNPGESRVVDYDPFVSCTNKMYQTLLSRDVKLGFVELTYTVEKPCKIVDIDSFSEKVTKTKQKPVKKQTTVDTKSQIKTVLEEVTEAAKEEVPVVELETNKVIEPVVTAQEPVDMLGTAPLQDEGELLVTAPDQPKTSKKGRKSGGKA